MKTVVMRKCIEGHIAYHQAEQKGGTLYVRCLKCYPIKPRGRKPKNGNTKK